MNGIFSLENFQLAVLKWKYRNLYHNFFKSSKCTPENFKRFLNRRTRYRLRSYHYTWPSASESISPHQHHVWEECHCWQNTSVPRNVSDCVLMRTLWQGEGGTSIFISPVQLGDGFHKLHQILKTFRTIRSGYVLTQWARNLNLYLSACHLGRESPKLTAQVESSSLSL